MTSPKADPLWCKRLETRLGRRETGGKESSRETRDGDVKVNEKENELTETKMSNLAMRRLMRSQSCTQKSMTMNETVDKRLDGLKKRREAEECRCSDVEMLDRN